MTEMSYISSQVYPTSSAFDRPSQEENMNQTHAFPSSQQAFSQLSLPAYQAGQPQNQHSNSASLGSFEKTPWPVNSRDFESLRSDPSYAKRLSLPSQSPNYTVSVPHIMTGYSGSNHAPLPQQLQYPYGSHQLGVHLQPPPPYQQHQAQQGIVKPVLTSQLKFPDASDSVVPSQSSLIDASNFSNLISTSQHHTNHLNADHYHFQPIHTNGISVQISDDKFDALISTSKQLSRKRSRGSKSKSDPQQEEFLCNHCGKVFAKNYNLKSHLKTHSDEKPFNCSFCSRSFARNHDKKRHELLHKGIKRFQCGGVLRDNKTRWGCGKRFSRADGLSRHFKTDIGWLCVRPLMLEAKEMENDSSSTSIDHAFATSLDINFINDLIKRK